MCHGLLWSFYMFGLLSVIEVTLSFGYVRFGYLDCLSCYMHGVTGGTMYCNDYVMCMY